jgi:hypothetical protein
MRTLSLAVVLVMFVSAFAEPSEAVSLACGVAIKAACGNVKPTGGHLKTCFESNKGKLSWPCGDELSHALSIARACEADVRKLCGGVQRGADILGCMRPRLAEVREPCLAALGKVGVQAARKR